MSKIKLLVLFVLFSVVLTLSACGGQDNSDSGSVETPPTEASQEQVAGDDFLWTPGTYTGVGADGFAGNIYVEVVVDGSGQIASITVTEHGETESFMEMVEMQLIPEIINAQSTEVDAVVGATLSSEALIRAVEDALRGAQ